MPGGLVEDKSNGESTTITTTITHSYIVIESKDQVEQDWDTQFWIVSNNTFQAGQSWTLSMNVKAEKTAQSDVQIHKAPSEYISNVGRIEFGTDWKKVEISGNFSDAEANGYSLAFNLNVFDAANKYYFDDISEELNRVDIGSALNIIELLRVVSNLKSARLIKKAIESGELIEEFHRGEKKE